MSELASKGQLRMSLLRWALVTVPAIVLLGILSGEVSGSGYGNPWFDALNKPSLMPPGWAFGLAWTILYIAMGIALAIILNARGARWRGLAIILFVIQLILNLCWSPLFFARHEIAGALYLIVAIFLVAAATTVLFWRIRRLAGILLVPYLLWLCFATYLNAQILSLNPEASRVVTPALRTQI